MHTQDRHNLIKEALDDARTAFLDSSEKCADSVVELVEAIVNSMEKGGKVLLFGNGGSAADAQHIAAEFVNRFRMDRRPLAAIALTTDTSILTSISNDFDYDRVFSKQVEALTSPGDVVIGISTSGNSPNIIRGLEAARKKSAFTVGLTGKNSGKMEPLCDIIIKAQSTDTPRIQEVHIFLSHIVCDLVEKEIFASA